MTHGQRDFHSDVAPGRGAPSATSGLTRGRDRSLVKAAWRQDYKGLSACMAVAWDSQLSPVDARTLKASQLQRDPVGWYFKLHRAKTVRGAMGSLSRRAKQVLVAYMSVFGADLMARLRSSAIV